MVLGIDAGAVVGIVLYFYWFLQQVQFVIHAQLWKTNEKGFQNDADKTEKGFQIDSG